MKFSDPQRDENVRKILIIVNEESIWAEDFHWTMFYSDVGLSTETSGIREIKIIQTLIYVCKHGITDDIKKKY